MISFKEIDKRILELAYLACPIKLRKLANYATVYYSKPDFTEFSENDYKKSIEFLMENKILMRISNDKLLRIKNMLNDFMIESPLCGLPKVNDIELTEEGIDAYKQLPPISDGGSFSDYYIELMHDYAMIYAEDMEKALKGILESAKNDFDFEIEKVEFTTIGPWCVQWWDKKYAKGIKCKIQGG